MLAKIVIDVWESLTWSLILNNNNLTKEAQELIISADKYSLNICHMPDS